ncbi:hypothetical protein PF010_g29872 [Phytophthora fragariae]|uniref:Uncharacterized protein n=1 Tax=Phytophthora fragariae TaxID=53985 RepID=A0A6G0JMD3_9STRA|nr:hypothetical protein PF010_g29872 [Phytophthora fragariae]
MSKRACVQTSVEEQVKKLKVWQQNKGWSLSEAARALSVKPNTLLGWRDKLSNSDLSFIKDPSTISGQYRKLGGGRPHKVSSYESRVVEFYENCIRDGGIVTSGTLKTYCKNIEEFALLPSKTQASWIRRFLDAASVAITPRRLLNHLLSWKVLLVILLAPQNLPTIQPHQILKSAVQSKWKRHFLGKNAWRFQQSYTGKDDGKKIAKKWPHLSLKLLEDAVKVGAPYVEFASRLRQLKVVTLERATISVGSAAKVTATPPDKLVGILPRSVLASCGKRIDAFVVKWKKTRGAPIKRKDVVVTTSGAL